MEYSNTNSVVSLIRDCWTEKKYVFFKCPSNSKLMLTLKMLTLAIVVSIEFSILIPKHTLETEVYACLVLCKLDQPSEWGFQKPWLVLVSP